MLVADRKPTVQVVVRGNLPQVFAVHPHVEDRQDAQLRKSVLVDEMENGVLTWEETDSYAVQA
jgi:hypothetical protein